MKKGAGKLVLLTFLLIVMLFFIGSAEAYNCPDADNNQALCDTNSADCVWQDPWCNTLNCWSYYSQTTCEAAPSALACSWQTMSSGWCEQIWCYSFKGTNQTACETTADDYGLNCQWNAVCMGGGMGVSCWDYTTEATCTAVSGCSWGECYEQGCWSYSTSDDCVADSRCVWDSTYSYCTESGCWRYSNSTGCAANSDCYWSTSSTSCYEKGCGFYDYNQTACTNTTVTSGNCYWSNPYCMEGGCTTYWTQSGCQAATGINCTWSSSSGGWCDKTSCWGYSDTNQSACENSGLNCKWNSPWCDVNMSSVNCASYTEESDCFDSFYCWWDYDSGVCNAPMGGGTGDFVGGFSMEEWNPGCYIFDINTSYCYNVSGCTHNGTNCNSNSSIQETGIKCEYINDSTVCNNMPGLSKCCQWSAGACVTNNFSTSCWENMEAPPEGAMFCEDYKSYTSQTLCEEIANYPWFMPCKWDNSTKACKFKAEDAFGAGSTGGVEDLNSKKNCEYAGGQWIEETYCINNTAVPAGWCEMKFGAGAGGKTCDTQCWACEFKDDGTNPASATAAEDRCVGSNLGICEWRTDTSAANGYGHCKVKDVYGHGASDCDSECWACLNKGDWQGGETNTPKYHCEKSLAACKWEQDLSTTDTTQGWCMPTTDKTCNQDCVSCYDQAACVTYGNGGSGNCTWDNNTMFCKATGGSASEICYDGMDNDGDNIIDCSDKDCFYDPFCSAGTCSKYSDQTSCNDNSCSWLLTADGGYTSGRCAELGELCYEFDGNESGCTGTAGCIYTTGGGMCEVNETMASACRAYSTDNDCTTNGCAWFTDPYCTDSGTCSWGWCSSKIESCSMNWSKQSSQTACEDANCIWESMTFFGGADFGMMSSGGWCTPRCFNSSLNTQELCDGVDGCKQVTGYCSSQSMGATTGGRAGSTCDLYGTNQTGCGTLAECGWMPNPQPYCDKNMTIDCSTYTFDENTCTGQSGCVWDSVSSWCIKAGDVCMMNASLAGNQANCNANTNCTWIASESRCDNLCFGQGQTACGNATLNPICTWKSGFCSGAGDTAAYTGMEAGAPIMMGSDTCPETGMLPALDICELGVKEMTKTLMFGAPVQSFKDAAICNGKYTTTGMGAGKNATMFYIYLDTDGTITGGCNSSSSTVADKIGYEFMFKYEITWDTTNADALETKTAYKCSSNKWVVTPIPLSVMTDKMCGMINGPILGISKSDITKLTSLYNLSQPMRVYAATANSSNNRLNPIDTIGPVYYTAGSADARIEDCMQKGVDIDGDGLLSEEDPDCSAITRYGYIRFEDCYSPQDDDGDELLNCSDPDCLCEESDCGDLPVCNNLGVNAPGYTDNTAPKLVYYKVDAYVDAALLYYDTSEASNGTVLFYENDSACATLNTTINDVGIWHSGVKKFKGWHEAPFENDAGVHSIDHDLRNGTAYYYKMKVCDKSGNCLTSSCMNFTTAGSLKDCPRCDFIFKLNIPTGWKVHLDFDQNAAYELVQGDMCGATAGTLVNYTRGRNVSIFLNNSGDNSGMYFYGVRLSKAGYNNQIKSIGTSGTLKAGTTSTTGGTTVGYTGMNAETRDKLINKLHPQLCRVKIPGSGTCPALWHCDDNLTNCVDLTTKSTLIETASTYCIWQVPYCEFSTWSGGKPGTSTTTTTTTTTTAAGGGAGSLGTSRGVNPSITYLYDSITSNKEESMSIDEEGLYITKVVFIPKKDVTASIEVHVEAIPAEELELEKLSTPVYQYVHIKKSGITDYDVKGVTINFKVLKSWLEENNIDKEDVYLMIYNGVEWETVFTTLETSSSITGAVVGTSGGSSLRKVWEWIKFPFKWLKGAITGYVVYAPSDYEYYVAKLGRMDYVAITGTQTVIEGVPEPVAEAETLAAAEAAEKAAAEALAAEEKPAEAKKPWIAYIIVLAVIIIVIAVYLSKKKHKFFMSKIEKEVEQIEKKFKKK